MAASSSPDAPPLPPSFPLPAVHSILAPYLAPPSNALHLRHIITAHLRSLSSSPRITSSSGTPTEFDRFLDYELSQTPSPHRDYLTALRNYSQARAEYNAISSSLTPEPDPEPGEADPDIDPNSDDWRKDYLTVLQLRRHYARLQLLREGVNALSSAPSSRSLKEIYTGPPPRDLPEELQRNRTTTSSTSPTSAESSSDPTIRELEKRIITLSTQLTHETALLNAAKQRSQSRPPPSEATKLRALQSVQIALTQWLEEKLSIEGPSSGDIASPHISSPQINSKNDTRATPATISNNIAQTYSLYLSSRKELLSLLSPLSTPPPLSTAPPKEELKETLAHRLDITPPPPRPTTLAVVEAAEKVRPLKHTLKSTMGVRNYLTSEVLKREVEEDVREKREQEAEEGERKWRDEEEAAMARFVEAKRELEVANALVGEVETLANGEKKKRAIPVRGASGKGRVEDVREEGVWTGLRGDVGVIGDGI
ncbi:hypothetical protein EX30DRAFT_340265 [Ascodesmis nigricans]|uniref:Uncharacterized protein n=1 Tax=Ascodesmis nigricans TaxID=341454 RepID=A0A4S2MYM9_9PEZI|nr:hypothetical protein EX30DRAFT_340265 [Ascodesmis nigricans]